MRKPVLIGVWHTDPKQAQSPTISGVSDKAVQSGATVHKLDSQHYVYVNPSEALTKERIKELMGMLPGTKSGAVSKPASAKDNAK